MTSRILLSACALFLLVCGASPPIFAEEAHPASTHANEAATATTHAEDSHGTADDEQSTAGAPSGQQSGPPWATHPDTQQPPLAIDPYLLVGTLVLFVLFIRVMKGAAWQPMIDGLDEREARVVRAEQAAHKAKHEADRLRAETEARMSEVHTEVKALIAEARGKAESEGREIIAQAQAEAQRVKDSALAEIEQAHQRALDELNAQVENQVSLATGQLLGR
ncbi:MAG: ATP synthase F0 subunit B [Planctomycetaceae bacterium]|nr:ATP synthase F0 subunit B [Planctomycetaceae bacterium]